MNKSSPILSQCWASSQKENKLDLFYYPGLVRVSGIHITSKTFWGPLNYAGFLTIFSFTVNISDSQFLIRIYAYSYSQGGGLVSDLDPQALNSFMSLKKVYKNLTRNDNIYLRGHQLLKQ